MRNYGIDLLKIVCCIGVVALHTTINGFRDADSWNIAAYFYYIGTFAIPLFFMINGYFMLRKKEISIDYIKGKILTIIFSVIIWNLIIWVLKRDFIENPVKKIVGSLIQRGYFFQFWFFGSLIIIYLTLPLLKKFLTNRRTYVLCLVSLGIVGLIFEVANYLNSTAYQIYVIQTFRLWTWYFYYILGGFVSILDFTKSCFMASRFWRVLFWLVILMSPIIFYYIAQNLNHNIYAEFLYDTMLVKVLATGLFVTFLNIRVAEWARGMISVSSGLIMGVFIVHSYVMKVVEMIMILDDVNSYLLYFILVFVTSFMISYVISKVPIAKRLIRL